MRICLAFDATKMKSGSYGQLAWHLFWRTLKPKELGVGTRLFCGDLLSSNVDHYGIVVDSGDASVIATVKSTFMASDKYRAVCAGEGFLEGTLADQASSSLIYAGSISGNYSLNGGDSDYARAELGGSRLAEVDDAFTRDAELKDAPARPRPASTRTADLPAIPDIASLKAVISSRFPKSDFRGECSILPEELCDLRDACGENICFAWTLGSAPYTESFVRVYMLETSGSETAVSLTGMFNFPSRQEVDSLRREYLGHDATILNIVGATALNFVGPKDVSLTDSGKVRFKENAIQSDVIWKYVLIRQQQLGCPRQVPRPGEARKSEPAVQQKPASPVAEAKAPQTSTTAS